MFLNNDKYTFQNVKEDIQIIIIDRKQNFLLLSFKNKVVKCASYITILCAGMKKKYFRL